MLNLQELLHKSYNTIILVTYRNAESRQVGHSRREAQDLEVIEVAHTSIWRLTNTYGVCRIFLTDENEYNWATNDATEPLPVRSLRKWIQLSGERRNSTASRESALEKGSAVPVQLVDRSFTRERVVAGTSSTQASIAWIVSDWKQAFRAVKTFPFPTRLPINEHGALFLFG